MFIIEYRKRKMDNEQLLDNLVNDFSPKNYDIAESLSQNLDAHIRLSASQAFRNDDLNYININDKLKRNVDSRKIKEVFGNNKLKSNKNYSDYIKEIHESWTEQNLVLILGAGISIDYNLPTWGNLLKGISKKCLEVSDENKDHVIDYIQSQTNNLIYARMLKNVFEKSSKERLSDEIQRLLYQNYNSDNTNETLSQIVNICLHEDYSLKSIITYNYDNLLETELEKFSSSDSKFEEIYDGHYTKKIPIYHIHGYLPKDGFTSDKITLVEDEYHMMYSNDSDWRNMEQINALRKHCCLFVGHSLNDPNLRRILDKKDIYNKHDWYIIALEPNKKSIEDWFDEKEEDKLKYTQREKLVKESILTEMLLKESDFDSLNIKVLWCKDKTEISSTLNSIYNYQDE